MDKKICDSNNEPCPPGSTEYPTYGKPWSPFKANGELMDGWYVEKSTLEFPDEIYADKSAIPAKKV